MFSGLIGALRVDLGMNSAEFKRSAQEAQGAFASMRASMQAQGAAMRNIGAGLTVGVTAPVVAFAKKSMDAAKVQQQAVAGMEAALASMGMQAGYTSQELQAMASDLQNRSLFGDEEILQKVTANLLTFGNVTGDVFARAQQSAVDLSARLGQDLQSSAIMLGKALNDPVAGLTALSRVGVSFTEQQKEQIRAMAQAGDVAGAQALMLAELERQYSGQAQALRDLPTGEIQAASMAIGDAMEHVGAIVLPVVADVARHVRHLAEGFQGLDPEVNEAIVKAGLLAAAIGPVVTVLGVTAIGIGALISPVGAAVAGFAALAAGAVYVWQNFDDLKARFDDIAARATAFVDGIPAALREWQSGIEAAISSAMSDLVERMQQFGRDIVDGLVSGIKAKAEAVKETISGFGSDVGTWFKDTLGIRSPSRVFKGFGENIAEGLAIGVDGAAGLAERAVVDLGERLAEAGRSAVDGVRGALIDGLSSGDLGEGVRRAFDGYGDAARSAFGDVLSSAFGSGGGGIGAIGASIKSSLANVTWALSGGLSLGGIGGALGAALPIVGMVSAIAGLISSFSSSKQTGSELQLGVGGGRVGGSQRDTYRESAFWGLFSWNSAKSSAMSAELQAGLQAQLDQINRAVVKTYDAAGVDVTDAYLRRFSFDLGAIDTFNKSQEQIAAEIARRFEGYTSALSNAIGGVGLDAVATFAQVQAALEPAGMALRGSFRSMALAAEDLADLFGGADSLGGQVSQFVSTFYTEAEQIDLMRANVGRVFSDIGQSLPKTLSGFKALVLSQDLLTEAGRENYAALIGVSAQFAQIIASQERAAAAQAQAAADVASSIAQAAEEAAARAAGAFARLDGWYRNEFDARLARIGQAQGYSVAVDTVRTGGAAQIGGVRLAVSGNEGVEVILNKIHKLFATGEAQVQSVTGAF